MGVIVPVGEHPQAHPMTAHRGGDVSDETTARRVAQDIAKYVMTHRDWPMPPVEAAREAVMVALTDETASREVLAVLDHARTLGDDEPPTCDRHDIPMIHNDEGWVCPVCPLEAEIRLLRQRLDDPDTVEVPVSDIECWVGDLEQALTDRAWPTIEAVQEDMTCWLPDQDPDAAVIEAMAKALSGSGPLFGSLKPETQDYHRRRARAALAAYREATT